jgi:hypothetical protein
MHLPQALLSSQKDEQSKLLLLLLLLVPGFTGIHMETAEIYFWYMLHYKCSWYWNNTTKLGNLQWFCKSTFLVVCLWKSLNVWKLVPLCILLLFQQKQTVAQGNIWGAQSMIEHWICVSTKHWQTEATLHTTALFLYRSKPPFHKSGLLSAPFL